MSIDTVVTLLFFLYWILVSFVLVSGHRNLRTAFRDHHLKAEGVYMVDPQVGKVNSKKRAAPVKLLSVEGLKKALRLEDMALLFTIFI